MLKDSQRSLKIAKDANTVRFFFVQSVSGFEQNLICKFLFYLSYKR